MKKLLISLALLTAPLLAVAGISINIGEPNYYGQIQIGNERPQLLYAQPVIVQPSRVQYPPLYLRVPPDQTSPRKWRSYCGRYNACGRPVYFVNDNWYRNTYAPQYRHRHPPRQDYGRGHRGDRNKHYDRGYDYNRDNRNYDKRH
jgi:hypothetical protein